MRTMVLKVALEEEQDGRWSASVPALPGCSSWGYSAPEALANIKDAADIYIEDMKNAGEMLPGPSDTIALIEEPAIAVSVYYYPVKVCFLSKVYSKAYQNISVPVGRRSDDQDIR